ncbi:MAG: PDZ domain-containing protein, partial [Candidatus Hydrogenedentes bacterium]|nr:PDZ domain-containing protein [Candidatus Hydrogenedentota bacterium]
EGGIVVATVLAGSSAQAGGILSGDVIVDFNGVPVSATQDKDIAAFTKMVRESPIEEELPVTLYREGVVRTIRLTLMPRPKTARDAEEFEDSTFGLTVRELTRDVRIIMNLSDDVEGVIVRRAKSGSSANLAGIRPNFIILRFGEYPIRNLKEFEQAVAAVAAEAPDEVTVFCRIGATTAFFRMRPRWDDRD